MAHPLRLTRSRKRGARIPAGAINCCRPTLWGNPFIIGRHGGHAKCVILHRDWLAGNVGDLMLENLGFCPKEIEALHRKRADSLTHLHTLAGKLLVCWCPQSAPWCHVETLLIMAPIYAQYERMAA